MLKPLCKISALAAAFALLSVASVGGAETPAVGARPVSGEKQDSGLGTLPHYRDWAQHPQTRALVDLASPRQVPGEKQDSGLGELPHYRYWVKYP